MQMLVGESGTARVQVIPNQELIGVERQEEVADGCGSLNGDLTQVERILPVREERLNGLERSR